MLSRVSINVGRVMSDPLDNRQIPGRRVSDTQEAPADLNTRLTALETRLNKSFEEKFDTLAGLIKSAFPEGDPHGHRIAHERQIKSADAWDRIRSGLVEKVMTGAVISAFGFLAMALWDYFKEQVNK